jgi:hypothetical protein
MNPTEAPPMPSEVESMATGAEIGTTNCVPEIIPSLPLVVPLGAVPAGAVPPEVPAVLAEESPSTPADVEPTVTGAVTGATTWVPEATPFDPLVPDPEAVPVPEVPAVLAEESPSTPADVEPTVTGAVTGATT